MFGQFGDAVVSILDGITGKVFDVTHIEFTEEDLP